MSGNVISFPVLKHTVSAPKPPVWRSGQCVRHLKQPRSVGIIRAVHICPLFGNVSALLVDFDTVRQWCKPDELAQIPHQEMS